MKSFMAIIAALLFFAASPAQARHHHYRHHMQVTSLSPSNECMTNNGRYRPCNVQSAPLRSYGPTRTASRSRRSIDANGNYDERIVSHPAGCPWRAFCGCGASVRIFGHPIRDLFLAANWRRFPPAAPAPGMVAWRYGHVFVIEQVNGDGTVVAYDANSGGHLTRVHTVPLRGFRVVNPNGGKVAMR